MVCNHNIQTYSTHPNFRVATSYTLPVPPPHHSSSSLPHQALLPPPPPPPKSFLLLPLPSVLCDLFGQTTTCLGSINFYFVLTYFSSPPSPLLKFAKKEYLKETATHHRLQLTADYFRRGIKVVVFKPESDSIVVDSHATDNPGYVR